MEIQNKRILFGLLALIPVALAFVIVCLLLSVKRDDPRLLKRKLRIGALILTLTTFTAQGTFVWASCYEYVEPPPEGYEGGGPWYGGGLTYPLKKEPPHTDPWFDPGAGIAVDGVAEKLGIGDWGIDRDVFDFRTLTVTSFV